MSITSLPIIATVTSKLGDTSQRIRPYRYLVFLLFVAGLYGFVLLRINSLTNAQPTDAAVSSQVQAAQLPHFNQSVIDQLQSLQDNSVSVQTLFNESRDNPFQNSAQ